MLRTFWIAALIGCVNTLACGGRSELRVIRSATDDASTPVVDAFDAVDVQPDIVIDTGPPCVRGDMRVCYDGPAGTESVGLCRPGVQICNGGIDASSGWSACAGEVVPTAPACDGLDHACTGSIPDCLVHVMCPAPIRVETGVIVDLAATASVDPPGTLADVLWTVVSQPPGAVVTFGTPMATTTTFSADTSGVYVVQFEARTDQGRSASCTTMITVSPSYRGRDFYAVSTVNSGLVSGDVFHFAIAIGNHNATAVTVDVSGGALTAPMTFSVPAGSTTTQTLPWVTPLAQNSLTLAGCPRGCCDMDCGCGVGAFTAGTSALAAAGAYHIHASAPVSAYQFNALEFSSNALCAAGTFSYTNDASLLLPTDALSGQYLVVTHNAFTAAGAFVAIAATGTATTTVTVTLTAPIAAGTGVAAASAGSVQTYVLNPGDVVQLVTTSPADSTMPQWGSVDLSGTTIRADQPVAVFAGVDCTFMSGSNGTCPACDHLEQQLFPEQTWGHDVVVSQLVDRDAPGTPGVAWTDEPYWVRIMARDDGTALTFTPPGTHPPVTLNRGQWVEFCGTRDFEVTSTGATPGAFLVEQYMAGQFVLSCNTCDSDRSINAGSLGDPSALLAVPTAQYRRDYDFVVPATYTRSFVNVIVSAGDTVLLDGAPLAGAPTPVPGTSWNVYRLPISAGSHAAVTTGANGFGLEVLGVARRTSYAYPGGLDLSTL